MTNAPKILINTGPSERGWHRLEAYLRCPQLYAWGYGRGGRVEDQGLQSASLFPPGKPLVRGSIGHAGLAHLYSRVKAAQEGRDPDAFYGSIQAMELVARTFGDLGALMLPIATAAVKGYVAERYSESFPIVGVEEQRETNFLGYRYTARIDLEYQDRSGKIWFCDHKLVSKIENKVYRRYVLSGQFLGMMHLGARIYGDQFGGVQVNLLSCTSKKFLRFVPEPAPYTLERFPEIVRLAEEGIADVERRMREGLPIPAAPSEHTCMGSYGECPAFELCRWGGASALTLGLDAEEE
jgi:PD-(D/E)XK nuclease superfamily protein